jgi:hypothetical protein
MKTTRCSQTAVLIGLAVGLCALWAGGAPVGLYGDLLTGSWIDHRFPGDQGGYVICTTSTCYNHMDALTSWLACNGGPIGSGFTCYGGSFIGAAFGAGMTVHDTGWGSAGCWHPAGGWPSWYCSGLSDAAFY